MVVVVGHECVMCRRCSLNMSIRSLFQAQEWSAFFTKHSTLTVGKALTLEHNPGDELPSAFTHAPVKVCSIGSVTTCSIP